jgi:hypothetical protein
MRRKGSLRENGGRSSVSHGPPATRPACTPRPRRSRRSRGAPGLGTGLLPGRPAGAGAAGAGAGAGMTAGTRASSGTSSGRSRIATRSTAVCVRSLLTGGGGSSRTGVRSIAVSATPGVRASGRSNGGMSRTGIRSREVFATSGSPAGSRSSPLSSGQGRLEVSGSAGLMTSVTYRSLLVTLRDGPSLTRPPQAARVVLIHGHLCPRNSLKPACQMNVPFSVLWPDA